MGKSVTRRRYVCEILRCINDLHQDETEHSEEVRELLREAESGAKAMVRKLEEYKAGTKKEIFTEPNKDFKEKKKLRRQEGYQKL